MLNSDSIFLPFRVSLRVQNAAERVYGAALRADRDRDDLRLQLHPHHRPSHRRRILTRRQRLAPRLLHAQTESANSRGGPNPTALTPVTPATLTFMDTRAVCLKELNSL